MDKYISSEVPDHAVETLEGLDQFRKQCPELCDFTLVVDNHQFPCHRSILCLYSEYFRGMISGKFSEHVSNVTTLNGISPQSLSVILDYLYTGRIEINQSSVESILETACRIQSQKVIDICVGYLRHQIDETNSLTMFRFGKVRGLVELAEAARNFTYERMEAIFEINDVVKDMTPGQVDEILQDHLAHLHGEEQMVMSILKWITVDERNRMDEFEKLIRYVDWERMSTKFILRTLFHHPLITSNKAAKRLVVDQVRRVLDDVAVPDDGLPAMSAELTPVGHEATQDGNRQFLLNWGRKSRTRVSDHYLGGGDRRCPKDALLLIGGLTLGEAERGDTSQPNVMCFYPRSGRWETRSSWPERKLRGFSVTKLHNDVVVTGGCDFKEMKRTNIGRAWRYAVDGDSWERLHDMTFARSFHSSCQVNGELFAVGGAYSHQIDIEIFEPHSGQWKTVKDYAPKHVWNFAVAPCNGKIILIGSGECSRSIVLQCYNPSVAQWSLFRSPNVPRHLSAPLCTTSRDGEMVFLTGDNSQKMFVFDPNQNQWSRARDMLDLHANGGMTTVGQSIYLTGGHWEDDGYWDEMESFDLETGSWTSRGALPHLWLYHTCTSVVVAK